MLYYQLALTSVDFDDSYTNVINFKDRQEQEEWFDVDTLFVQSKPINFNVDSLIKTTLTFINDSDDLSSVMNFNYCIVKDNKINATRKYYYYFIKETKYLNNRQVMISVELDIMNTYFLDIEIDDCLIERAHLNRFREISPTEVELNLGKDSLFYEKEPIQATSKYLRKRKQLNFIYNTDSPFGVMNTYLNDSARIWCYVFLSIKDDGYKVSTTGQDEKVIKRGFGYYYDRKSGIGTNAFNEQPYLVLCYPINNKTSLAYRKDSSTSVNDILIDSVGLNDFLEINGGFANVLSMKLSTLAPFEVGQYDTDFIYNNDEDKGGVMIAPVENYHNLLLYTSKKADNHGIIVVDYQFFKEKLRGYVLSDIPNKFLKETVKTTRSLAFNPKLLCYDYFNISLVNGANKKDYDFAKVCPNVLNIDYEYTEVISPDITKQYIRIKPTENSIYSQDTINNFDGLVSSIDYSLPYSKNNLDIFLANNKNFFMQKNFGYAAQTFGIVSSTLNNVGKGNVLGAAGSLTSGIASLGASAFNQGFEVDNMESSPEQLANANGNSAFNVAVNNAGLYLDYYESSENEKRMIDDFTHLYGFTYNRIDKISNVINIRHNFNFVKAQVEVIRSKVNISNEVRNTIKRLFNNGITFWNVTGDLIFEHNVPNYERWIDD